MVDGTVKCIVLQISIHVPLYFYNSSFKVIVKSNLLDKNEKHVIDV